MFKKSDKDFFERIDIIQKVIIFFIIASLGGGIGLCFVSFVAGILMATVLPVLLIVLSLILHMMTYAAIDAKLARNKAYGEDDEYLLELLDLSEEPEMPSPYQKYIDKIMNQNSDNKSTQDVKFVEYDTDKPTTKTAKEKK